MLNASVASSISSMPRQGFQRVKVNLHGRYMLADRSEFDCRVVDMSPGDVVVEAPKSGTAGERVVMYIDHIGRVEGKVTEAVAGGFAIDMKLSERKRDKIAAQLTWLANKHELDLPEDRRHERIVPRNPVSVLTLTDGRQYRCRIIDLSLSGAAVELAVRPALGTQVTLGNMRGQVVRHFDDGIAIEFAFVQRREQLADFLA